MASTHRTITYWKGNNVKARTYSNLTSNDENTIVRWLYQQGVVFNRCSGEECHDIGDTDYFHGSVETDDINIILAFIDKLYGEWTINAIYNNIDIVIKKQYPNITHHLSFKYPDLKETMMQFFEKFEQKFCYLDIKEATEYR